MFQGVGLGGIFLALAVMWALTLSLPSKYAVWLPFLILLGYGATAQGAGTIANLLKGIGLKSPDLSTILPQDPQSGGFEVIPVPLPKPRPGTLPGFGKGTPGINNKPIPPPPNWRY